MLSHNTYELLHQNEMGYVNCCLCCGEIQFCIGNLVSHTSRKGFENLHTAMDKLKSRIHENLMSMPDGERVLLRTPAEELLLSLSPEQYDLTLELFERAKVMLQVNELLK